MNKSKMPNMNLSLAETYVINWNNFEWFFTHEALSKNIRKRKQYEFITNEYVPINSAMDNHYKKKGYPLIATNVSYPIKEYKGEWERTVDKKCNDYRIPYRYQMGEGKLFKDCLLTDFPYLEKYSFNCYKLDYPPYEIYINITTEGTTKSLYCPLEAFILSDPEIIKERHNSYHKGYYATESRKKYLDEALSLLEKDKTLELFEDIRNFKRV